AGPPLNERLRIVDKSVRQRVVAHIADRQGLPLAFQDKIHAAGRAVNTAGLNSAPDAHSLAPGRAFERVQLGQGVVIRLTLAVAEPRQKTHREYDDPRTDAEFGLLLHARHSSFSR